MDEVLVDIEILKLLRGKLSGVGEFEEFDETFEIKGVVIFVGGWVERGIKVSLGAVHDGLQEKVRDVLWEALHIEKLDGYSLDGMELDLGISIDELENKWHEIKG
jgi:hypothetical protein